MYRIYLLDVFKILIMKLKARKGALSVQAMAGLALAFVLLTIILGIGGTILTEIQSGQAAGTAGRNASTYGLTGVQTMGSWLPTIALIIAAAVVIGVIIRYFQD